MILWFLRFFSQFRDLEMSARSAGFDIAELRRANEELITEKAVLAVRIESAMQETARAWQAMQDALHGERLAMQMQVNHAVQKSGGGIPYPNAHSLPASTTKIQEPGPVGRRGRELPSESIAKATQRGIEAYIKSRMPEAVNG